MNYTFKSLINTTGKVVFAIGLILNVCMLFFGVWPSLVYLLLMLIGAATVYITANDITIFNYALIKKSITIVAITCLSLIIITIAVFFFAENYFNKRDTINECKEMMTALKRYEESTHNYPANLSILIEGNPLRTDWITDQWGKPYKYVLNSQGYAYVLKSAGSDNKFNTTDDLTFIANQ